MDRTDRPILVVVPLPPTYRGGTEEYAYQLARRFSAARPVQIVSSSVDPTPESPPIPTDSAVLERLPARAMFERPLLKGGPGRDRLKALVEGAALVQLHMPFPFVERKVVQWGRSAGVPVVLTYHMDADLGGARPFPGAGLVTAAYRSVSAHPALSGASAVVVNSAGYAKNSPVLRQHLDRVRVIPKGVDLARFGLDGPVPPGRVELGPSELPGSAPGDHRVLFVGRLVPYKGLPVLLDAVARTVPGVPDLQLYIAGKGPERERLEALVRSLKIEGRTHFLGFVPDDRMGPLYRSADVVACPSIGRLESSATTLEEAAALGTPTLGSSLPGAEESIPNDGVHGLLCPPGDAEALARALDRLLSQPRPDPRPGSARTWDEVADQYWALFRELGLPGDLANLPRNPHYPRPG